MTSHRGDVLQVFTALAKSLWEFIDILREKSLHTEKEGHVALNCFHTTVLRFIKDTKQFAGFPQSL